MVLLLVTLLVTTITNLYDLTLYRDVNPSSLVIHMSNFWLSLGMLLEIIQSHYSNNYKL